MKVVINTQDYTDVEIEKDILREGLPGVEIVETDAVESGAFIEAARGARGALVQYAKVTAEVIDTLTECEGYVRYGVGYDNIDAKYAWSKGKKVAYVPTYCLDEVSNHAAMMILALARKLSTSERLMREGGWHVNKIRPCGRLSTCTLGMVGLGNIGKQTARKMAAFVRRVLFYDPYVDAHAGCEKVDDLGELFAASDIVSLHPLLTEETRGMVDGKVLARMKPTGILVNTSRGAVVVERDLVEALGEGRLAGAGLDVFEEEPLAADSPLRAFENVIMTHHMAWYSEGALAEVKEETARQMVQIVKGEMPTHPAR